MDDMTINELLDCIAFDVDEAHRALNEGNDYLLLLVASIKTTAGELYEAVIKSRSGA